MALPPPQGLAAERPPIPPQRIGGWLCPSPAPFLEGVAMERHAAPQRNALDLSELALALRKTTAANAEGKF